MVTYHLLYFDQSMSSGSSFLSAIPDTDGDNLYADIHDARYTYSVVQ